MLRKTKSKVNVWLVVSVPLITIALLLGRQEMSEQELKDYVQNRSIVIQQLLRFAKQKPASPIDIKTQIRIEKTVRMLGELRAVEATEFLIDHIAVSFPLLGAGRAERGIEIQYPAVWALIRIGYPSVQAILNRGFLQERSELEQKLIAHVIREVLGHGYRNLWEVGTRLGRLIIQEHLRSAKPPSPIRERLMKFMGKHFPEMKPTKRR